MYKRQKWTIDEDQLLISLVTDDAMRGDWEAMSDEFSRMGHAKTSKQIKTRWTKNLAPELKREKWSSTELETLFAVYTDIGNKWCKIAESFDGRTDNCVKNQFFSCIRKALRFVMKASGQKMVSSCTKAVNDLKPKVLSQFIEKTIVVKGDGSEPEYDVKVIDVVKAVLCENQNFAVPNSRLLNREVLESCVRILETLNGDYVHSKSIKKRRTRGGQASNNARKKISDLNISKLQSIINADSPVNKNVTQQDGEGSIQQTNTDAQISNIAASMRRIRQLAELKDLPSSNGDDSGKCFADALAAAFCEIEILAGRVQRDIAGFENKSRLNELTNAVNLGPNLMSTNSETSNNTNELNMEVRSVITEQHNDNDDMDSNGHIANFVCAKNSLHAIGTKFEFPKPQNRNPIKYDGTNYTLSNNQNNDCETQPHVHHSNNDKSRSPSVCFNDVMAKWNNYAAGSNRIDCVYNLCFEFGERKAANLRVCAEHGMKKVYSASLFSRGK